MIAVMNENNIENIKSQMRRGVLEYCILSVLDKNDAYASELIDQLKDARIIVVEGTLYPLLTRQKNQGLLTYRWEESTQGPPRKYYSLTSKGRDLLLEMDKAWKEIVETLDILRK
ncbi:MAG: hypothetical protein LMBGKNDO_01071 [Bacteroidales bacterium]|jgi:PadR family transcriptional regulator PadR|nr:hypothetical protein [Bacteroidales bacterium]